MFEVEDITEEYGAHGVQCYSVVHNMEFYTVDVRASGFTVLDSDENELDEKEELTQNIMGAVRRYLGE